eukprot:Seg1989.3 transcript_id=Seg1989.3/GoldUCD/mRNA.D3Y31 product="Metabotropic glutamate receptor 4" protein_id=Seg1989.3/GoldUCD/D3Y31
MRWAVAYWNRHDKEQLANSHSHFYGHTLGFRIYDTCKSTSRLAQSVTVLIKAMLKGDHSLGAVGPPTAEEAIYLAFATSFPNLGIISYSSLSTEFHDRVKYNNVFSTVSTEDIQINILVDILKRYNWKYISTVSSDGTFGQEGIEGLLRLLHKEGIYTSTRNALPRKPTKADFDAVVKNLEKDSNARTVVLFTKSEDTLRLLEAAKSKTRFQWLSSTAWNADMQTIKGVKEAAKGAIILSFTLNDMKTAKRRVMSHFKNLTLNTNRYPWFEEFWEQQFNCTVKKKGNLKRKKCTGKENLKESQFYANYAASAAVVRAVGKFSTASRCAFNLLCPNAEKSRNFTECQQKIDYHLLRSYTWQFLQEKNAHLCHPSDKFNKKGTLDPDFDVVNFDGETYKTVGSWKLNSTTKNGTLYINDTMVVWYNGSRQIPQSSCSRPCKAGEKKIVSKLREICFRCEACKKNEILKNNKCIACHELSTPSKDRSNCKKLPKFHATLEHHVSILVLVESTIGFLLNTIVLMIFIKFRKSKIIKASSPEMSFFILAGLYLCFLSPCVFLLEPTVVRCGLRRFIFGISLTACYTPLMLKTNRIYRIFNAARSLGNMPHLVTQKSQILMCFGLLALQLLLCVMWVVGAPPTVTHKIVEEFNMVAYLCKSDILTTSVNLVPCFCMLAASTFYAFKSRKFHKNFNEALSIGVTMYISCALWAMLVPLLLWVKVQYSNPFGQLFVEANFCNVIGLVSLFGIFGPKVFQLMKFKGDEKDTFLKNGDRSNDGSDKKSFDMHTMGTMESEGKTINDQMRTINDEKRV